MSYGPLTMISVTLSSASSRSSGPWPRMSSAISAASRSRSSRASPCSCASWRRMSAVTRSRSATRIHVRLKSCGPSSPITARWMRFFISANGSCRAGCVDRPWHAAESFVELHLSPSVRESRRRRLARLARPLGCAAVRRGNASAARRTPSPPRTWRSTSAIGLPSLTERAISRSLGTSTSGAPPDDRRRRPRSETPTRLSARFRTSFDACPVVAHQRPASRGRAACS